MMGAMIINGICSENEYVMENKADHNGGVMIVNEICHGNECDAKLSRSQWRGLRCEN